MDDSGATKTQRAPPPQLSIRLRALLLDFAVCTNPQAPMRRPVFLRIIIENSTSPATIRKGRCAERNEAQLKRLWRRPRGHRHNTARPHQNDRKSRRRPIATNSKAAPHLNHLATHRRSPAIWRLTKPSAGNRKISGVTAAPIPNAKP